MVRFKEKVIKDNVKIVIAMTSSSEESDMTPVNLDSKTL